MFFCVVIAVEPVLGGAFNWVARLAMAQSSRGQLALAV